MIKDMTSQNFTTWNSQSRHLTCQGEWILTHIATIKKQFKKIIWPSSGDITIDGQGITKMDSAGAWLLSSELKKLTDNKLTIHIQNFSEQQQKLLSLIKKQLEKKFELPKVKIPSWLARIGKDAIEQFKEFLNFLAFIGHLTFEALRVTASPKHLRWRALVNVIDKTGYQALPIIALLSFMIGVVIAYQMGLQLRKYGANIFIVDLVGLAVLREFGPLLAAIMIAGRSGSAFTAQLGIMKINQEIDALNTMGVTPAELLLLPRIVGLLIALPLLTIWSDLFGVIGGMLMSKNMFDVSWYDFLHRFQREVPLRALIIGLGKSPVFALIISSIGCFEGMKVSGSAESVGKLTTRSVVLSIFFIIVADAIFSILFSEFKL